jgi:WD40 repeat protein
MKRLALYLGIVFLKGSLCSGQPSLVLRKDVSATSIDVRGVMLGAVTETSIDLWNLSQATIVYSIAQPSNDFTRVTFGIDSMTLITCSASGEIASWNMTTGEKRTIFKSLEQASAISLDFVQQGQLLACGFSDGKAIVFDGIDYTIREEESSSHSDVTGLILMNSGSLISFSGSGEIWLTNGNTAPPILLKDHTSWIRATATSENRTELFYSTDNGKIWKLSQLDLAGSEVKFSIQRKAREWITAIDTFDSSTLAYALLSGKIWINSQLGTYRYSGRAIVNDIKFVRMGKNVLCLAIADRKGLRLVYGSQMKFNPK